MDGFQARVENRDSLVAGAPRLLMRGSLIGQNTEPLCRIYGVLQMFQGAGSTPSLESAV